MANGWDRYLGTSGLFGTDDLGAGPRWECGLDEAELWFRESRAGAALGVADDPVAFRMIGDHDRDGSSVYMYVGDEPALAAGTTFGLPPDVTYPDLYSFLRAELNGVHALVPSASVWYRRNEEIIALLAAVPDDILVDTVSDVGEPWWRRGVCAKALTGRTPAARAMQLLDVVRDDRTENEVEEAVLGLLTATDGPHIDALLSWLRSEPGKHSGRLRPAVLRARAQLGDLTAVDRIVELAADAWAAEREVGEQSIDLLIETHGIRAVFGVDSTHELMVDDVAARRLLGVRLQQRSGGDLSAALADSENMVARAAYEWLTDDPRTTDTLLAMVSQRAPGFLWALATLAAQGHSILEQWTELGTPLIELPGVPPDVRAAILRRWTPGQRDTDPRWLLEAACTQPVHWPEEGVLLDRAMSVLTTAGLQPQAPRSAGDEYQQGAGTYYIIDTTAGWVQVSTLGPFFRASDQDAIDAMNGFRHIDDQLAATIFAGLSVYHFGDREPLPIRDLLFYWQD